MMNNYKFLLMFLGFVPVVFPVNAQDRPNIILIYADDLGYGDVSCYGAKAIQTPNIDKLAKTGRRFTNAHSTASTCTPSRFSLLTGIYPWRKSGTGIATGDAALLIPVSGPTLPGVLKNAGYNTAVVGKWHLGLGDGTAIQWNAEVKPGPRETGFNYSFILPATGDRVPCVYMENGRVVNLDPTDPIAVSYHSKVGDEPTGYEHPELLKLKYTKVDHDKTIINGVSRIGYMAGGKTARWKDEDMAKTLVTKADSFIRGNRSKPFFLFFSAHDIHVPRLPHRQFAGRSSMGPRGDAILQLDWTVGEIVKTLKREKQLENTMIIFSSDNGPVLDDGYDDGADILAGNHSPSGPFRGGKFGEYQGGTRIPFIVSWPGKVKPGESDVLISQSDLLASFAGAVSGRNKQSELADSFNMWDALMGNGHGSRTSLVTQSYGNTLSLIYQNWKYIERPAGTPPELYNLSEDIAEKRNVFAQNPAVLQQLKALLQEIKNANHKH
ncbi:sulfatase family protein [Desertivirga xinjiangensis]|uniref:sulfatase family protein n=1 Tax=Desertivirga xinjiangensis TaxID=539206 RepID=UPI00210A8B19|nr:arylsulfatase [Pedobacter xinjiangensis]